MLWMLTLELRLPSMMPLKGCGVGTGGLVDGGWMRWMSTAVILSPCFAADCPMSIPQLIFTTLPLMVICPPACKVMFPEVLISTSLASICTLPADALISTLPLLHAICTLSPARSEEHTSELQSQFHLVCRLLLEKKKKKKQKKLTIKKKKKRKK